MGNWQNCQPEEYEGAYPMLQICDDQESYCAAMGTRSRAEMVEDFIGTYRFSDEHLEDIDSLRDDLRDDLKVLVWGTR